MGERLGHCCNTFCFRIFLLSLSLCRTVYMLRPSGVLSADGAAFTARAQGAVDGWIYVFRLRLSFSANAYRKRTAAKVCVSGAANGVIRRRHSRFLERTFRYVLDFCLVFVSPSFFFPFPSPCLLSFTSRLEASLFSLNWTSCASQHENSGIPIEEETSDGGFH